MRTPSGCQRGARAQSQPWDWIPGPWNQHVGVHTPRLTGPRPQPRSPKPQEATEAWQGHRAGARKRDAPRALWSLRGRLRCLGRGWYQQGLGEGGSCHTKRPLNRNPSLLLGLGQEPAWPPSMLSGPAAQPLLRGRLCPPALSSEKPPGCGVTALPPASGPG